MATTEVENEALTNRVHSEIIENGDVEVVGELYEVVGELHAEDVVVHGVPGDDLRGRDEVREHFETTFAALSPVDVTEEIVLSEDDLVAVRRTDTYAHDGGCSGPSPPARTSGSRST